MDTTKQKPDWWRPVWICIAGEQAVPNVSPLLPFPPQKVYYLHTNQVGSESASKRCQKFLQNKRMNSNWDITTILRKIPSHNMTRIRNIVMDIINRENKENVLINWTGGTKPMAFAALLADITIANIYFDSRNGLMVDFQEPDQEFLKMIPPISIEDMLQLNADITEVKVAQNLVIKAQNTTKFLVNIIDKELVSNSKVIPKIFTTIKQFLSSKDVMSLRGKRGGYSEPKTPLMNPLKKSYDIITASEFLDALRADKLLKKSDGDLFWPTINCLRFLDGMWWESFVEDKIKTALELSGYSIGPDNFKTNLEIRWGNHGNSKNEFDVVFLIQDRLYLISCTTASESETEKRRTQLQDMAEKLGGRFAHPMLACTLIAGPYDNIVRRKSDVLYMPKIYDWFDPVKVLQKWNRHQ